MKKSIMLLGVIESIAIIGIGTVNQVQASKKSLSDQTIEIKKEIRKTRGQLNDHVRTIDNIVNQINTTNANKRTYLESKKYYHNKIKDVNEDINNASKAPSIIQILTKSKSFTKSESKIRQYNYDKKEYQNQLDNINYSLKENEDSHQKLLQDLKDQKKDKDKLSNKLKEQNKKLKEIKIEIEKEEYINHQSKNNTDSKTENENVLDKDTLNELRDSLHNNGLDNVNPNDIPFAPQNYGMTFGKPNGWSGAWYAGTSVAGQCTEFSSSLMYAIYGLDQRQGNGQDVVANWVSKFGKSKYGLHTPSAGAVASCPGGVDGNSPTAGHTFVVEHVYKNNDILIVEGNSLLSGNTAHKPYTWNYRIIPYNVWHDGGMTFYHPTVSAQ